MLHLHHSNHLEALSQRLVHLLEEAAPGPFDAPQVIVPSTAMRRWLTLNQMPRPYSQLYLTEPFFR